MALADPQTVTIDAVPYSLPRVGSGDGSGVFREEGGAVALKLNHAYGKRKRSVVRFESVKLSADPLLPSTNVPVSTSFQLVLDRPIQGYTNEELKDALTGFLTWLTASSGANITKILGGEA